MEGRAALRLEALLAAAVRVAARLGRLGPALGVAAVPTRATATAGSDQLACYNGESFFLATIGHFTFSS